MLSLISSAEPVATRSVGLWGTSFTWPAALMLLLNILVGGALVAAVKNWPKLKELANTRRRDELDLMSERVTLLEGKLESKDAAHAAEIAILRHRTNNLSACLDAILMLIEAAPEKATEHVAKIRAMRAKQELAEAAEKGAAHAANITAAARVGTP